MSLREDIAEAAIEFIAARDLKLDLKKQRASFKCTEEEAPEFDFEDQHAGVAPCWHDAPQDISQMCEPCQKRQAVHFLVLKATERATKQLNKLRSYARRSNLYKCRRHPDSINPPASELLLDSSLKP